MAETGNQNKINGWTCEECGETTYCVHVHSEAVEGAARVIYRDPTRNSRVTAEAVIRAFLDAMGMRVEQQQMERFLGDPGRYRYVSRWFPIKAPVDE